MKPKEIIIFYRVKSPYQLIELCKIENKVCLLLNDELQFIEGNEEKEYHYHLAKKPIKLYSHIQNILILGGGDGLAIRDIIQIKPSVNIVMIELDPYVVQTFKMHPVAKRINNNSLSYNRLKIINTDAFEMIKKISNKSFDLVIMDLVDDITKKAEKLYSETMLSNIARVLKDNGIFSMYFGDLKGKDKKLTLIKQFFNIKDIARIKLNILGISDSSYIILLEKK